MTLAERLRAALAASAGRAMDLRAGDLADAPSADPVPAAVLVAVVDRAEPGLLLTRRNETLRAHAGQVAFPGGRIDPGDADPIAAALREAEEEIGLPRAAVEIVGMVEPYLTVTGYRVTPVLAVVPPDLPLAPQAAEVAELFEVPLAHALDPARRVMRTAEWDGRTRHYLEIEWQGHRIWGATAAMLANLALRLAP